MSQTQPHSEAHAVTGAQPAGTGQVILDLLGHLMNVAEDDGDAEMAAAVHVALKRCAAIHVRRREGHLLGALKGIADQ